MGLQVGLKTSKLGEGLATLLTGVWPLPCVDAHVLSKDARDSETFATLVTGVGSLPSMDSFVHLQVLPPDEGCPTTPAFEHFFFVVSGHVLGQDICICKPFTTLFAGKWALTDKQPDVLLNFHLSVLASILMKKAISKAFSSHSCFTEGSVGVSNRVSRIHVVHLHMGLCVL